MKMKNMRRLERAENTMLKWMCGVALGKLTAELMDCLDVLSVQVVIS